MFTFESYPADIRILSFTLFHLTTWTLSLWIPANVALHYKSSRSQILTVESSLPDARYSCYNGFKERHITASVWVPISSPLPDLWNSLIIDPPLALSLFSRDPRTAVGSTDSASRFQISISGKKVPTMTWFVWFSFQLHSHSRQSG